jgi:hypothetical protein
MARRPRARSRPKLRSVGVVAKCEACPDATDATTATEGSTRRARQTSVGARLRRRLFVLLVCILLGSARAGKSSHGTPGDVTPSTVSKVSTSSSEESSANNSAEDTGEGSSAVVVVSEVLQITETELWDGAKWKSGDSRWTMNRSSDSKIGRAVGLKDGKPCVSPAKQEAPEGWQFDRDWKIVTGGASRDSYGWEYTVAQPFPARQRVWLRNLVPDDDSGPKKETFKIRRKASSKSLEKQDKRRRSRKLPRFMQAVADDFNFKGFGMSFYKSLVFAESFGMAFRLPLTFNFGRWETNPGLPSVSSTIGLFFPGTASLSINTSVRLEFLKWISSRIVEITVYLLVATFWTFWRGMVLALSASVYPFTRRLYQPPIPLASPWARPSTPNYSRTIEERLGCSVSWRLSRTRGYEFRVMYWHYYAPTLASFWPVVKGLASFLEGKKATMPDWWARRSAAAGLSTSWPIPDDPHVTSSLAMSLSGFYFRPAQTVRLVPSASPSSLAQKRKPDTTNSLTLAEKVSSFASPSAGEGEEETDEESEAKSRKFKRV